MVLTIFWEALVSTHQFGFNASPGVIIHSPPDPLGTDLQAPGNESVSLNPDDLYLSLLGAVLADCGVHAGSEGWSGTVL